MINIAKIINDKYYTSPDLAEYCVKKTKDIIGEENITEYIEPSAGAGVFLDFLNKPYLAYDIEPEDIRIQKQDYLTLDLEYKQGRCIIGNPPFGRGNSLAMSFYKKSVKIADCIAFILPISQYNNNVQLYNFDLIYSEDLGEKEYSNIKLHCCFNIYKRPNNGDEVVSIAYDLLADTYNEFVITNVREDLIYTDWQECYNYCSKLQDERIPF